LHHMQFTRQLQKNGEDWMIRGWDILNVIQKTASGFWFPKMVFRFQKILCYTGTRNLAAWSCMQKIELGGQYKVLQLGMAKNTLLFAWNHEQVKCRELKTF
jgi:hypothetical protein